MNGFKTLIVGMVGTFVGLAEAVDHSPLAAISRDAAGNVIAFRGTLQVAPAVTGPWTDLTEADSPLREVADGPQRYYRTREPDSIFMGRAVVSFHVTGPLQTHFDLAFAGRPDGIFPPVRQKPDFDGTLTIAGFELPVKLKVRGNSSLQECPFPKLKVKISKEQRAGTPFFDAKEVKIGTHCAEGGRGTIGRLRDERAAYREALAYETMDLLGFISPRVRRARIDYSDTSPTNANFETNWQLLRSAMVLDDVEVVAARVGGQALSDEEVAALTDAGFDEQLITDLRFLHVLLGNWDFNLSTDGRGLWNTEVIQFTAGGKVPVAGDFDLASWVTERPQVNAPGDYHPDLPDVDRRARYELEQLQQSEGKVRFTAASERFTLKKTAMEALIHTAVIDDAGRTNALRHVTAFYDALTAVGR